LRIDQIRSFLPFRYLVSGGVRMWSLMPGFTHSLGARFEQMLESQMQRWAMFVFISVRRR
jgi:hypothetical protein